MHSLGFGSTLWKKLQEENEKQQNCVNSINESGVTSADSHSESDSYIENLNEENYNLYTRSKDRRGSAAAINFSNKEIL